MSKQATCDYKVPHMPMISNTTNMYNADASSSELDPYLCFSDIFSNGWHSAKNTYVDGVGSEWIQLQFPKSKIKKYQLTGFLHNQNICQKKNKSKNICQKK